MKTGKIPGVTIKDIAKKAGVSIATVSRVINEEDGVGRKTRVNVLKIVKSINYYPNLQARGLVMKKPNVLGLVIPRTSEFVFSNPFYSEVLKGIASKARETGQHLLFSFAGKESYARMVQQRLAAGIIVIANRVGDPWIDEAWTLKIPIVLTPGDPSRPTIPSVDGDSVTGGFLAIDYLAQLGHRRIAFLSGPMNSKYGIERLAGYQKALRKNRLPFQEDLVFAFDATQEGGYAQMKRCLSLPETPTAVLVINDYSAMGALRAAKKMGYRVPKDISIIGYGDVPLASMTDPPLTTIHAPYQKIGREAAEVLLKIIRGEKLAKSQRVMPVEVVVRESTAPPSDRRRKRGRSQTLST